MRSRLSKIDVPNPNIQKKLVQKRLTGFATTLNIKTTRLQIFLYTRIIKKAGVGQNTLVQPYISEVAMNVFGHGQSLCIRKKIHSNGKARLKRCLSDLLFF